MPLHRRVEGHEYQPLAVGRGMREPVGISLVEGYLLLGAAVGSHAPDPHRPGAHRVEIDPLPVRRVVRPVVEPLRLRQARLGATVDRHRVDVEFTVAAAHVGQGPAVGRPAMPIRRRERRQQARRPAAGRDDVHGGRGTATDGDERAVRRVAVVVVTALDIADVELHRRATFGRNAVEAPLLVDQQVTAVARPVGCFEAHRAPMHDRPGATADVDDFEPAFVQRWRRLGSGRGYNGCRG